jgi:molybdopterin synthase catalytic subunit
MSNAIPSIEKWLADAKQDPSAKDCGMYLVHNGTVRETPKAQVREGKDDGSIVRAMEFSYDAQKLYEAVQDAKKMEGIYYVQAWLNEGCLQVGDDIMYVLVGGDIRPHVIDALQALVGTIKSTCVKEIEKK